MTKSERGLVEALKKLHADGSAELRGTLVLGRIVGDLRLGGFLESESTTTYNGKFVLTRYGQDYDITTSESSERISDVNEWTLFQKPNFNYSKKLRRKLKNRPHLLLRVKNPDPSKNLPGYHFAILYGVNNNSQHQ